MEKINKHYVSPIDIKFVEFDAINPKSASQEAEIAKYKRLNRLRDKKLRRSASKTDKILEDF
jgi:hypothetical protein